MYIEPSASFKASARKTIVSIVIFAITYILLLIIAVGITIGFGVLGIWIFTLYPAIYTGIICLGLMASGLTVLFFLVKFVFASTKVDRSNLIEINREDQPGLFHLIDEVVQKVDTQSPKKVFLDADVNASVFYDSNFWSMFLPIRKNLLIGMGLINTTTEQELKAILAHEFGHFSQRSMKVGSYVYHVNKIIYNMLYNNVSLNTMLEKWANIGGSATIFIGISLFIIRQIQAVLQKLYSYVNHNYLALSREMEFHADEIAAHVAGSKALGDSLLRLTLANHAFQGVLAFYQSKINQQVRSQDIYPEQQFVLAELAKQHSFKMQDGLPVIELHQLARMYRSQLNLDNQWASHPSDEDRVKALHKLNIVVTDSVNTPAMDLLHDAASIRARIARSLFNDNYYTATPSTYSFSEFQQHFLDFANKENLDQQFNGYYDQHDIDETAMPSLPIGDSTASFEDLYSDAKLETLNELIALQNDRSVLQAIQDGHIVVKTFDYCGIKYFANQTATVLQQIDARISLLEDEVAQHDKRIHLYFRSQAINQAQEEVFQERFRRYSEAKNLLEENSKLVNELSEDTSFMFERHEHQDIEARLRDFARKEPRLKEALRALLSHAGIRSELDDALKIDLEKYTEHQLTYFHVDEYDNDNMGLMMNAITQLGILSQRHLFLSKKQLLNFFLQLQENRLKQGVS